MITGPAVCRASRPVHVHTDRDGHHAQAEAPAAADHGGPGRDGGAAVAAASQALAWHLDSQVFGLDSQVAGLASQVAGLSGTHSPGVPGVGPGQPAPVPDLDSGEIDHDHHRHPGPDLATPLGAGHRRRPGTGRRGSWLSERSTSRTGHPARPECGPAGPMTEEAGDEHDRAQAQPRARRPVGRPAPARCGWPTPPPSSRLTGRASGQMSRLGPGPGPASGDARTPHRYQRLIQLRSGKLSQYEPRADGTARALHADRLRAGREDPVRRAKAW